MEDIDAGDFDMPNIRLFEVQWLESECLDRRPSRPDAGRRLGGRDGRDHAMAGSCDEDESCYRSHPWPVHRAPVERWRMATVRLARVR